MSRRRAGVLDLDDMVLTSCGSIRVLDEHHREDGHGCETEGKLQFCLRLSDVFDTPVEDDIQLFHPQSRVLLQRHFSCSSRPLNKPLECHYDLI